MYKFGTKSQQKIATCHPDLQDILDEAIKIVDFTVLCGHRAKRILSFWKIQGSIP